MERTTWLTEERISAPAAGAPIERRGPVGQLAHIRLQAPKPTGSAPAGYGPAPVCGSTSVTFPTNDRAAMGRIAWHAKPLGSLGAGYG